jgi:hypothetical protein
LNTARIMRAAPREDGLEINEVNEANESYAPSCGSA